MSVNKCTNSHRQTAGDQARTNILCLWSFSDTLGKALVLYVLCILPCEDATLKSI